jgi:adenosylcobinamide-phosphate synthase
LYVTLGFRQFSFHFSQIRDALAAGNDLLAQELLADWQQSSASGLTQSDMRQRVMALAVLAAHRHVFGVLAWYSVLAALGFGPMGAVVYRLSELMARAKNSTNHDAQPARDEPLQAAANLAWRKVDWLPARITTIGFALVGRFEPVANVWRSGQFRADNDGLILAAASNAVGVKFGVQACSSSAASARPLDNATPPNQSPHATPEEPDMNHLAVIVGLLWRSVVVGMLLLALLTLSCWLG